METVTRGGFEKRAGGNMKVFIAIDSFKGSMTSIESGGAASEGIKRVYPEADIKIMPIADGGEGTVEALVEGLGGKLHQVTVKNPLGKDILAEYGIVDKTAVIEMAAASGIALVNKNELNPMIATTYGVGQMIRDAILKGCREFIVGIGGSATNDGGVGMLTALGYEFLDKDGNEIPFGAQGLELIQKIKNTNTLPELKECIFNIACDVTNPLCGENGCSAIFAPQKGAKAEDISIMDNAMKNYAHITSLYNECADMNYPGAGAAGGLGFAFMAYLNGKLQSGIELILAKIQIEKYIADADLVITGEGKIDSQTIMGKAPIGIAKLAKKYQKTVLAFSGCVTRGARVCNEHGIDAIFPIVRTTCTIDEAMEKENAMKNMTDCVEQVMRLYKIK